LGEETNQDKKGRHLCPWSWLSKAFLRNIFLPRDDWAPFEITHINGNKANAPHNADISI
jgi:hypothetical protein